MPKQEVRTAASLDPPEREHRPGPVMPHSHHSHSGQFCKHAKGTLEEVVLEAIRQGFQVFGLTEHVPRYRTTDLYPEEVLLHGFAKQELL